MTLKLQGTEKVISALQNVQSKLSNDIDAEIQSSANEIRTKAVRKVPVNFGEIKNSIGFQKLSRMRYSIYATAYHAPYVEFGTVKKISVPADLNEVAGAIKSRPKRGNFKSFIESIYVWGTKKKVIKRGDKNHAYSIARKIYMNGIKPQPYLWPSFLEVRPKLIGRIRNLLQQSSI